jgi:tRNA 2-(methylsulfanyl)-N6-isopentenyladenosine37 hydroxylase
MQTPSHLINFLGCATPIAWCEEAFKRLDILLIDHAHCERKAAASAIQLISKNPHHLNLIELLSPIAREELLHFEKVLKLLKYKKIKLQALSPAEYGKQLNSLRANHDNQVRLCDDLIIGAIIEARSCERFYALLPFLEQEPEIHRFYAHLAQAEQRHFEIYLDLAKDMHHFTDERLQMFIEKEKELILSTEPIFRFHSGIPHLI